MSQGEIAEALYFGHKSAPLKRIELPSLKNEYLVSFHDNGYRLAIYFKNNIDKLFEHIKNEMNCDFDKSNLKTKSLLITKNKVREFDGDIGIETAIQIARHP